MKKLLIATCIAVFILTTVLLQRLNAQSEKIKPYGNLYVFFGYKQAVTYTAGQAKETDRDTFYRIDDDSNIGFDFTYKKYSGVFELGISDSEEDWKVRIRKAYGIYKLAFGELMIGQAWNPYVRWSHEAANYYRSEKFGALYEYPITQLKFTTKFGLYIDIIKPYVPTETYYMDQAVDNPEASSDATNQEYKILEVEREITTKQRLENIQSMIPKLAVGYVYDSRRIDISVGAAGNVYQIKDAGETTFNKEWLISYLTYLGVEFKYGSFMINTNWGFSVNPANFGISVASEGNTTYYPGAAASIFNIATGKYEIKDTWNVQGYFEVGWRITQSSLLHLGYGFSLVDYPMENTKTDYAMEYYLNVKFNIGDLIALTPSVALHDYMKDMADQKEGGEFYGGLLATVSFY